MFGKQRPNRTSNEKFTHVGIFDMTKKFLRNFRLMIMRMMCALDV